nr:unnamed protein product [Callosobruchus analis]
MKTLVTILPVVKICSDHDGIGDKEWQVGQQDVLKIREVVENTNLLVCVLIDEIESLARARDQCISGTEPSDSIRVVNTLLTQIDEIRSYKNVLIFATSNMTETIDLAFVDRADIKQFLGLPSVSAIYSIYLSCLEELMKAQIIKEQPLERPHALKDGNGILSDEAKHLMKSDEEVTDSLNEDEVEKHKKDLEKLKETDPEFYSFLQENDKKLLQFNLSDEEPDSEAAEDETDALSEKVHKPSEDLEVASDESDYEDSDKPKDERTITLKMLKQWQSELRTDKKIGAL